jgi:UDP-3-O-[3-hydroxymyristoyl] glucosamine N-acyltransferase
MLGGQVGLAGHLTVGDGASAVAQTGISCTVEPGKSVAGSPHMDVGAWKRNMIALQDLAGLVKTVRGLARKVDALEEKLTGGS